MGLILVLVVSFAAATKLASGDGVSPTLASAIYGLESNISFQSDLDTAYMGLSFGEVTLQDFQGMVDALPNSQWSTILYWYAVANKYNMMNQTTIERALDSSTMLPNGLPCETVDENGEACFLIYDRYLFYGYYWADQFQYDQNKWNLTQAYSSYDGAVNYSQTNSGAPPLWIYGDNTAKPYSGRYYDETGESLEGYLEFYQFGVTVALSQAEDLWNFENSRYWNGVYYGYTSAGGLYECEAGGFDQIIWLLNYYDPNLPNTQNLLIDINSRYLNNLWNSPQWGDYVIQHANSNPQKRLENTQIDWQSIIAAYPYLSTKSQTEVQEMLNGTAYGITNGNGVIMPAWSLLSNQAAELYDPSTGLYQIHSDASPSNSSTALAADLLMVLGIIQTTAKLAVPLEELHYEYTYNIIDKDLYAMSFTPNSVLVPIAGTGSLTFLYGSTPVSCNFDRVGVWNVTFSSDWNTITSTNFVENLPTNRIYMNMVPNTAAVANYTFVQTGFPLSVNATLEDGANTIQIFANSTLVYNNTITANSSDSTFNCQIPTTNLTIGNYTLTENLNGVNFTLGICGVTYLDDLNGDFKVNFEDVQLFINYYLAYYSSNLYPQAIDYNQDGKINFADIQIFVHNYIAFYN